MVPSTARAASRHRRVDLAPPTLSRHACVKVVQLLNGLVSAVSERPARRAHWIGTYFPPALNSAAMPADISAPAAESSCVVDADAVWTAEFTDEPMPAKPVAAPAISAGDANTNDIVGPFSSTHPYGERCQAAHVRRLLNY